MKAEKLRVFFALWPDAGVAKRLEALAGRLHGACGGRRMRRETLHLTLAFVGDVDRDRLPALEAVGDAVGGPGFELPIDAVGYWPHNRIVWAGSTACPVGAARLADDLALALVSRGFEIEKRRFVPHVTLLRKAARPPPDFAMVSHNWPCTEFVLLASDRGESGSSYRRLASWPLAEAAS